MLLVVRSWQRLQQHNPDHSAEWFRALNHTSQPQAPSAHTTATTHLEIAPGDSSMGHWDFIVPLWVKGREGLVGKAEQTQQGGGQLSHLLYSPKTASETHRWRLLSIGASAHSRLRICSVLVSTAPERSSQHLLCQRPCKARERRQ